MVARSIEQAKTIISTLFRHEAAIVQKHIKAQKQKHTKKETWKSKRTIEL